MSHYHDILRLIVITITIALQSTTQAAPLDPTEEFTHEAFLDEFGNFKLFWKFDDEKITFEVHVKTTGYVGFGISPNGGMPGSDIVIGWVKNNGKTKFTDRHALDYGEPRIDDKQDYTLLYGKEEDDHTILKFERKIDTCDDPYDWIITPDTTRIIWAYHSEDPEDDQPLPWHGREKRGSRSLYLLSVSPDSIPNLDGENAKTMEFLNNNVSVPWHQDTTYICTGFAIPELNGKHHMIMYEPVIQPGNEALVHHFIAYQCHGNISEAFHGHQSECYGPNMPPEFYECNTIIIGWAVGGGPFYFPEAAGFSLGDHGDPTFFMLETHYDNPDYKSTFMDSSGVRIHYTSKLREYDAAMIMIGEITGESQVIPPLMDKFTTKTYCGSECTRSALTDYAANDTTDMHAFAGLLHTHLTGRSMRMRHIRDGVELPFILKDDYYDFNFQEVRHLPEEVVIKAGDSFIVECDYNTMDRRWPTYGGDGTYDEMCLAFVFVYPKTALTTCLSTLMPVSVAEAVNVSIIADYPYYTIYDPEEYANVSLFEYLYFMNWTDEIKSNLQMTYDTGMVYEYCAPDKQSVYTPTPIRETLPDYNRQCDVDDGGGNNPDGGDTSGCGTVFDITTLYQCVTFMLMYVIII